MWDANLTYSQPSGVVHNVDYPGWTTITHPTVLTIAPVNATPTSAIALYFVHFNVGNPVNGSCPAVFMQVRDGGASSRVLAHVCGDIDPAPVFSTGNQLSVVVKNTATSHAMGGWAIRFFMVYYVSPADAPAGCGGNVTTSEGAMSSPGYPTTFAQTRSCTWFVTGRARATLQLSFVAFAFNSTAANCESNYLEVYNGHRDTPDAKITRLCGQDMPATLQSSGSQLLVKMATNEKNTGVGFYARFKVQHDGCQTGYSRVKNQPKLSLFGVPQDEERRRLWDQNLNRADRPLQVTDAICELHFEQKYILRQYVHIIEGREVYIERGKPELRSDAVPIIIPHLLKCPDEQPTPEQSTKKRAASPPTCEDQPSKRTALQSVEPQLRFEDCESARQSDNAFELEDVVRPNDHWAMHKFRHYDGIAYVSASLSRELVSIEKTVLMNYGTDRSEVICRTYVRKTLISEKVAYNLEDAKQVLDCAESLHPCRGAGRAKDFTYDVLTKKLEQQISHSDGLVFSVTCKGAVKQQGSSCISCKYVRKVILTRKSYLKRKERRNSVSTKLRVLSQRNKRMATRLLDIAGRLEEMRANNANVADKILEDKISSLPRKQQASVRACFQAAKQTSKQGMRYNQEWILECLLMKLKSPRLYQHIRKNEILMMPSNTTLKRYLRSYESAFGFNQAVMNTLKKKTASMSDLERHGGLLVDEMKLSEHFNVTASGQIQGFVDLGEFTKPEDKYQQCDHGMVIMFVPFAGKWSQIVGVFATKGNVRGDILLKILMEATILVEQAGLFVDHITCDGAPWNRKMWKLAGVSASSKKINGAIQHPVDEMRKLHFISDFPHLLKCLRNGLLQKGFATPDGLVRIDSWLTFYKDYRSVRTLKVMPNLTETHLEPNSFEKMRTPFAFQLFGPYVLRGLAFYKEDIERRCGSIEATQLFFSKIQRLITVMTSRFRAEALRPASTDVAFLSNFLDFLNDWESFSDNKRHFLSESTAIGFRVTIANTLSLLKYLTESVGFKYLMTSRLSTDPVEHFFGIVRQSSGCNAHPSPDEFLITVNCLSFYNLAHSVDSANANPDMINALVTVHDRQGLKVTHKKIDDLISQGKLGEVESTIATMPEKFADHIDVTLEKSDSRLIYYTAGRLRLSTLVFACITWYLPELAQQIRKGAADRTWVVASSSKIRVVQVVGKDTVGAGAQLHHSGIRVDVNQAHARRLISARSGEARCNMAPLGPSAAWLRPRWDAELQV
ncbi:hypothetical protein HPB51_025560 [Rhipicephalus microplus]|uniref:Uncharacterized protein n=1 Tax=Rhipicephalus microplus TaxID=6941 RepID=A0A9J6DRU6_RHIMP|nr:hypothetical protein HPB51_025560 [Rhipicephalus microplus]